jgi:UDP-glucose 4-epimerase
VAKVFSQSGWLVTGVGHGTWSGEEFRHWGLSAWHASDITFEALLASGGEPDVVVHCAGSGHVGFSLTHPLQDFQRNVDTTAAVLEFVRTRAPRAMMLMTSSAAVYGDAAQGPISEDAEARPLSPYGMHKKIAEHLCASYAHSFGLRTVVLRLFSVYGPGLRKQLLWDACNRLKTEAPEFSGTGGELRDWLHVSDAAALILAVAGAGGATHAVLNGGTGAGTAVSEVLAELAAVLGTPAARFSGKLRPGDPSSLVADASRARALGWRPHYDWRRGIREYADCFRSTSA